MDLEFFMHGVPKKGQEWWGKEDDISYLQSFYARSEKEDGFLIELRRVGNKNYCYYSFLKYKDIVSFENRSGSYFGITVRFDAYCSDVVRLYRIFESLYKNYILGQFLSIDGRKYIVSGFDDSKIEFLCKQFQNLVGLTFQEKDFKDIPQQQLIAKGSTYKVNPNDYDCRTEQMIPEIQRLIFGAARIIISPAYPTFKEAEIQKNCDRDKAAIERAKAMEIASLNASLSKEKSNVASLSDRISMLDREKQELLRKNANLQNEARISKESIKPEIISVWKLVFSDVLKRQRANLTDEQIEDISDVEKPKRSIGKMLAVGLHFFLLLIIAGACSFLVCNSLGIGKDSSETEEYLRKIESLQTENERLLEDLNDANVKIEKLEAEKEKLSDTLNKQKKEKQVVKEQPKEPKIDVDAIKGKKQTLSVGEECVIRIMNLDDMKGGKWEVSNAEIIEQSEPRCKIRVKEGGPIVIKYLKNGKVVKDRTLQVEAKTVEKEQVEGKKSEEK